MERVTARKQAVLDVLDEEISRLEIKLAKAQPLIDELAQLKRTRATLLSERSVTGSVRAGTRVTMEEVVHFLREKGPSDPPSIAACIGADANTVRSHLNRHKDVRYEKNGDGNWRLIGDPQDEED